MAVSETVLLYVVIPALILLAVGGLAYASSSDGARRYRPGRPYEVEPVWFLAAQRAGGTPAIENDPAAARRPAAIGNASAARPATATGGASDRW
ncbi:hypothetical protein [Pilimelia columellifera]|uniref:Secreted protein n=1 Tax=Pilimelia columellifera subsp. columellifera TaxID=706583 RepID=A0ABN3NQI6_9ACTN